MVTLLKVGSLVDDNLSQWVPIEYIIEWFRKRLQLNGIQNRVLVLKSDTGSGKSTVFPAYIYKELYNRSAGGIAVTQPRIMNAITIVRDQLSGSPYYPFLKLGENLGWITGASKKRAKYGLTYLTIGSLLEQLKSMNDAQIMAKYRFIIIDEVHEATQEQSLLLYILKNFLKRNATNPQLPFVILTSATFDVEKFLDYFGVYAPGKDLNQQPNLIRVAGFAYPNETRWTLKAATADYLTTVVKVVRDIHLGNLADPPENRDILVFLPGMTEMLTVGKGLYAERDKMIEKGKPTILVLYIDGETVKKNKSDFAKISEDISKLTMKIKGKSYPVFRRVILSTIVAETGVTIDTLKYVVDSGFGKGPEFNPYYDFRGVIKQPVSKDKVRQRMGRANRKSPGVFYPIYPEYVFNKLPAKRKSDVEIMDVSAVVPALMLEEYKRLYLESTARTTSDLAGGDAKAGNQSGISRTADEISLNIDIIDKIPQDSLWLYSEKLYLLGLISPESDYKYIPSQEKDLVDILEKIRDNSADEPEFGLTKLGAIVANFTYIQPESIRMILAGYSWNVNILDLITIATYLQMSFGAFPLTPKDPINWAVVYDNALPRDMLKGSNTDIVERVKYLISDDFIDGLMIYQAVMNVVEKRLIEGADITDGPNGKFNNSIADSTSQGISSFGLMKNFCDRASINYKTITEFIKTRDNIIEQFLTFGLDIFYGNSIFDMSEDNLTDGISRIKYCIYDGFRNNFAYYSSGSYRIIGQKNILMPKMFLNRVFSSVEAKSKSKKNTNDSILPRWILYEKASLVLTDENIQLYSIDPGRISVLDGYVNTDLQFGGY